MNKLYNFLNTLLHRHHWRYFGMKITMHKCFAYAEEFYYADTQRECRCGAKQWIYAYQDQEGDYHERDLQWVDGPEPGVRDE